MRRSATQEGALGNPAPRFGNPVGELLAEVLGMRAQPAAGALQPASGGRGIDPGRLRQLIQVDVLDRAFDVSAQLARDRTQRLLETLPIRTISGHGPMIARHVAALAMG